MSATIHNLTIYRGDSYRIQGHLTYLFPEFCEGSECSQVPFNLDGFEVEASIFTSPNACNPIVTFGVEVVDEENGVVELTLSASDSAKLIKNEYSWNTIVNNTLEDTSYTAFVGKITIKDR